MSSGFGAQGGIARCFGFFKDLEQCVESVPKGNDRSKCIVFQEDYFECLHHLGEKQAHHKLLAEKKSKGVGG